MEDDFRHLDDEYLIKDPEPTDYVLLPEEKVTPMNKKYLRAVKDLIGQANAGIKYDLCRVDGDEKQTTKTKRNNSNNILLKSVSHFNNSHLAKLLTPLYIGPQYATELQTLDDVTFFMIRDNATVVRHQMDHILQKRPKFFCINDNMNRSRVTVFPVIHKILGEFFEMYFPHPSSFEKKNDNDHSSSTSITIEYIWQHPQWYLEQTSTTRALARALQYGFTVKEFDEKLSFVKLSRKFCEQLRQCKYHLASFDKKK